MELSILQKLGYIFKFFTSSFLGIELFLIVALFSCFLILNNKYNNKIVKYALPIFIGFNILSVIMFNYKFVIKCIRSFMKSIMYYYYFPNMALYFVIVMIVSILFIYTLLNDNMDKIKKIINYIFFTIIYMCFIGMIGFVSYNGIKLVLDNSLYKYSILMSFVQFSNLMVFIWIIITMFYYLYKYFKKKFD